MCALTFPLFSLVVKLRPCSNSEFLSFCFSVCVYVVRAGNVGWDVNVGWDGNAGRDGNVGWDWGGTGW